MGAPTAEVQSTQSSNASGKGAGSSPSTPAGSTTMSATSGQPTMGAPNPYGNPADPTSFTNTDASGNRVNPMQVPSQYMNTVGSPNPMMTTDAMNSGASGKGAAAGGSQGKGGGGSTLENMPSPIENTYQSNAGQQNPGNYK
jgi:uncharacterized protein (DUF1800 family)